MIYTLDTEREKESFPTEVSRDDVELYLHKCARRSRTVSKGRKRYNTVYGTFDIETTSLGDRGIMYIWQSCIDGKVFCGRRWEDYIEFTDMIGSAFRSKGIFLMFVHYLPFEFQFIRNFFHWEKVFAVDIRQPVTALSSQGIEYRCSYKLTNMSLAKFTETSKSCTYVKASGEDFDYRIKRYPWTALTPFEYYYCYCDVMGLWQALSDLIDEEESIAYLPLTSTGYVRRDCMAAMFKNPENRKIIKETALSEYLYVLMRTARRGGDTHADATIVGEWLENVDSWDLQSAYPYVMMCRKYPMTQFNEVSTLTFYEQSKIPLESRTLASILVISFDNICIKDMHTRPYIPLAKCTSKYDFTNDNGRIMKASHISMVITDIDYDIIKDCYEWENENIEHVFAAEYEPLPRELREQIHEYFYRKTTLKGKDAYLYMKSKNKLNAIFGMMLTDLCHTEVELHNHDTDSPWQEVAPDYEKALNTYYNSKSAFLAYQWGVWVTAHCRYLLHEVVKGDNRLFDAYNDTDSHKMVEGYDKAVFEAVNERIHALADSYDVPPYVDYKGKRYYLGEWEYEDRYRQFKTLGAKKYIVVNGEKCEITVSGLSKDKAARYLDKVGHEKFKEGTVFPPRDSDGVEVSGRTASVYHDVSATYVEMIDGQPILCGSSLSINDVSYTLGLSGEYVSLLDAIKTYSESTVL